VRMLITVAGQDEPTLNQGMLEHFNPGQILSLRISANRSFIRQDLENMLILLNKQEVHVSGIQYTNIPYPFTLDITFTRPSVKKGYSFWRPLHCLQSFLSNPPYWELSEAR